MYFQSFIKQRNTLAQENVYNANSSFDLIDFYGEKKKTLNNVIQSNYVFVRFLRPTRTYGHSTSNRRDRHKYDKNPFQIYEKQLQEMNEEKPHHTHEKKPHYTHEEKPQRKEDILDKKEETKPSTDEPTKRIG